MVQIFKKCHIKLVQKLSTTLFIPSAHGCGDSVYCCVHVCASGMLFRKLLWASLICLDSLTNKNLSVYGITWLPEVHRKCTNHPTENTHLHNTKIHKLPLPPLRTRLTKHCHISHALPSLVDQHIIHTWSLIVCNYSAHPLASLTVSQLHLPASLPVHGWQTV